MSERDTSVERPRQDKRIQGLGLFGASLIVGTGAALTWYDRSEVDMTVAGREATISPTFDGYITADSGMVPPQVRYPVDLPLNHGLRIDVGSSIFPPTEAKPGDDTEQIIDTIASIVAQPSGEVAKVRDEIQQLQITSAVAGGLAGSALIALYVAVGPRRRRELLDSAKNMPFKKTLATATVVSATLGTPMLQAHPDVETQSDALSWGTVSDLVPQLREYPIANKLQVRMNNETGLALKLVAAGIESREKSKEFYSDLKGRVETVKDQLRLPEEGETVALVVSDRHSNIGMDPVLRATGDAVGATIVFNAGDDTASGKEWEEYSLNSFTEAFKGYEIVVSPGNHDGEDGYVAEYYERSGATVQNGKIHTVSGVVTSGASDPRTSDFTSERHKGDKTIAEVGTELADTVCASNERVSVMLVHDADIGTEALTHGCVDLVIAGHDHVESGPTAVEGEDGALGYTFTNGTSGGATYAISTGSKLRRDASTSFVTFREGRPVGIQSVRYRTNREVIVGDYIKLTPRSAPQDDSLGQRVTNEEKVSVGRSSR